MVFGFPAGEEAACCVLNVILYNSLGSHPLVRLVPDRSHDQSRISVCWYKQLLTSQHRFPMFHCRFQELHHTFLVTKIESCRLVKLA